jgi:hypothetical protein
MALALIANGPLRITQLGIATIVSVSPIPDLLGLHEFLVEGGKESPLWLIFLVATALAARLGRANGPAQ